MIKGLLLKLISKAGIAQTGARRQKRRGSGMDDWTEKKLPKQAWMDQVKTQKTC